jgi:hypothetical protein
MKFVSSLFKKKILTSLASSNGKVFRESGRKNDLQPYGGRERDSAVNNLIPAHTARHPVLHCSDLGIETLIEI